MAPDVEGGGLGRVLDDEENRGNLSWLRTMVVIGLLSSFCCFRGGTALPPLLLLLVLLKYYY